MNRPIPTHLLHWIDARRHLLRPPVGNQAIWDDGDFMVTVVGGPNAREDFHINEGEEIFYQLEGDIVLRLLHEGDRIEDLPIRQGEIYLLRPRIPHSPQRPSGTIGLVIERKRQPGELDGFVWLCRQCGQRLYEEFLAVTSIVTDLPPVFARFYGNPAHCTCTRCGTVATPRGG